MGFREITLSLNDLEFFPELSNITKELQLSSNALKSTFFELLEKQDRQHS